MNNETCKTIRHQLVDYSDGLLPAEQVQQTEAHLAECSVCREELHLLERSLELAKEVWSKSNSETVPIFAGTVGAPCAAGSRRPAKKVHTLSPRKLAWMAGSLAVCAAIIFIALGLMMFSSSKPSTNLPQPNTIAKNNSTQTSTIQISTQSNSAQPKEEIDVMEYIAREDRSARLAASVEILSAEPTLQEYKENAERYLKQTYPDTVAVRLLSKQ